MTDYLTSISKRILVTCNKLSKVKFAKIIYLVHKGLVQADLSNTNDLKFVRMPLGPVPLDFHFLYNDKDILIETKPTGLTYDMEVFKLKREINLLKSNFDPTISKLTKTLSKFPTSELVAYTHGEPSWKKLVNGTEYYIQNADLHRRLPSTAKDIGDKLDQKLLQGRLLDGMLDDIVQESTKLEYPDKD
jgi:hypothetical protein